MIAETPIRPDMASFWVFLGHMRSHIESRNLIENRWFWTMYASYLLRVLSQENPDDSEVGRTRSLQSPHECSVGVGR